LQQKIPSITFEIDSVTEEIIFVTDEIYSMTQGIESATKDYFFEGIFGYIWNNYRKNKMGMNHRHGLKLSYSSCR
jgi:hypothetical protein